MGNSNRCRKRHDLSKLITDTAKVHGGNSETFNQEVEDLQDSLDAAISILTEEQLTTLTEMLVEKEILPKEEDRTDDWKYEVTNGDTKLGYDEWLQHQKEMQSDE
jgi:hypothetical protein